MSYEYFGSAEMQFVLQQLQGIGSMTLKARAKPGSERFRIEEDGKEKGGH